MKEFLFSLPDGNGGNYVQLGVSLEKDEITDEDLYMVYYALFMQLDNVILKKLKPDHMSQLDMLEAFNEAERNLA